MAQVFKRAFGRYLRVLRTRKGLSLGDVEALSEGLSEHVERGNLSRCENGQQSLGLSKLIPLSRIYEVPADAIVDRIELDLEVEQAGRPDTASCDTADMIRAGSTAARRDGRRLEAYAWFRDALGQLDDEPSGSAHVAGPSALSLMANCATMALRLGRMQLALHEFSYLESARDKESWEHVLILNRIATTRGLLGQLQSARQFARRAIDAARAREFSDLLAASLVTLGGLMIDDEPEQAIEHLHEGLSAHRQAGVSKDMDSVLADRSFEARTLLNLVVCYLNLERLGAARRTLEAARRNSTTAGLRREIAVAHYLAGRIDDRERRPRAAARNWHRAVELSRAIGDKSIRFCAELELFEQAIEARQAPAMRALARRLTRLAPSVGHRSADLERFHRLLLDHPEALAATGRRSPDVSS